MKRFVEKVSERFLRYVKINTMSSVTSTTRPSTPEQFDLARVLRDEMTEMGVSNVYLDEQYCVVYGTIPSTLPNGGGKSIGFVAHMDTIPDFPGDHVKPWVYENYPGGDVVLNKEKNIVLKTSEYPKVLDYIGDDIIFTDGTTVLGGDDKAGVAVLMTAAEHLLAHPEIPHGPIQLAFTPDEEIGGLARDLDFERFGAEAAYTLDGEGVGVYTDETFNGITAEVEFCGVLVHPGTAKDILKNPVEMGVELINMLPLLERPQHTEEREGYYYPESFNAAQTEARLTIIIRDHDKHRFDERVAYVEKCVEEINRRYGNGSAKVSYHMGYSSMKEVVAAVPWLVETLEKSIEECGVKKQKVAIRGGTDGSSISERGLPCPNINTGYHYGHGPCEFASEQALAKCTEIIVKLCENLGKL